MKSITKKTGYVESYDGTPIYYEMRGQGKPLFFVYGIVCLINHWHKQLEHFSHDYQTIIIDYRGHHKTPMPTDMNQLSIDALAQDVIAVCKKLEIPSATFLGHSFGAQVLLRTFDLSPQLFKNLIFVNGFASNPFEGMLGTDISVAFQALKWAYEQAPESLNYIWRALLGNPFAKTFLGLTGGFNLHLTSLSDIEVYLKGVANIDLSVFTRLAQQMVQYDARPVLDRINVPTLIISGESDKVTPFKHQKEMLQRIKQSQMQLVPYGSHCSQLDMPDLVNLRIEQFLREQKY